TSFLMNKAGLPETNVLCIIIGTIVGFIASLIVNYILSLKWVYQDFDRTQMRKHWKSHISLFVVLNIVGLFIRLAIMTIFKVSVWNGLNINIDNWMIIDIPSTYTFWQKIGAWITGVFTSLSFWWFVFAFTIKNITILIYNYLTWKKFIFKGRHKEKKISSEMK
ncbi:MAG: hypothetical protein MJ208_04000, partial [Bacilli bacterium]|nr:hypothetical protein [Bacilli bacterium]